MNRRYAKDLAARAAAHVTNAGVACIGMTNALEVQNTLAAGLMAAVVNPPTVTYETWTEAVAEWQLWLIAAHTQATDLDTAWDNLDSARDALAEPLGLDTATPDAFVDAQGTTWPALICTFTTDHLKEN